MLSVNDPPAAPIIQISPSHHTLHPMTENQKTLFALLSVLGRLSITARPVRPELLTSMRQSVNFVSGPAARGGTRGAGEPGGRPRSRFCTWRERPRGQSAVSRDMRSAVACLDDDGEACIAHPRFPRRGVIRTTSLLVCRADSRRRALARHTHTAFEQSRAKLIRAEIHNGFAERNARGEHDTHQWPNPLSSNERT